MTTKDYKNYNVAILAFGQFGQASEISFRSLIKLNPKFTCVLGDKIGITSVKYAAKKFGIKNICIHKANISDLKSLKLPINSKEKYVAFGQDRFMKLTTFKWQLIKQSLIKHSEVGGVYFSDLDVLWVNMPNKSLMNKTLSNGFLALQDDSRPNQKYPRYCTGVMYWKNCKKSLLTLDKLFQVQLHNNLNNKLIHDETAFNSWLLESNQKELIKPFPRNKFIIGYKYFDLFMNKSSNIQNIICYHANYTIGERSKFRRLRSIEGIINKERRVLILFIFEMLIKVLIKLKILKIGKFKK